jgi:hypothetical protein
MSEATGGVQAILRRSKWVRTYLYLEQSYNLSWLFIGFVKFR